MRVAAILLCGLLGAAAYAAAPKPSKAKTAKTGSKSKTVKTSSKGASSAAKQSSSKKSSAKAKKPAGPPRQTQPTTERYREIQEALIARGFLEGPATGQWDSKSIEALKRFEQSQNLTEDGKLDSLALIALGLGPQRTQPVPPATEAQ